MARMKHYQHDHSQGTARTGSTVKPISELYADNGARAVTPGGITKVNPNIAPAPQTMRRSFREGTNKRVYRDAPGTVLCVYKECRAYPMKGKEVCVGHFRQEQRAREEREAAEAEAKAAQIEAEMTDVDDAG
jgi:hypothetical protein